MTKKAHYRLRIYQLADGSTQLVYGDDPAPEGKLLSDQDITQITTIVDRPVPK